MYRKMIVCHIETSAGARFSVHPDEEDLRKCLIEYHNEVHTDGEGYPDTLPEDASLHVVREAIEEIENVSSEEIWFDPLQFPLAASEP